ncbi:endo-1,4-beta-xylanase [Bacteroidales bacterium]|nr:endo-1,4-beta-xylanase [Bacteroidales bacterium]
MKRLINLLIILIFCSSVFAKAKAQTSNAAQSLKKAYADNFFVGCAIGRGFYNKPAQTDLVTQQFNSIVAENCMKSGEIQPKEGQFYWDEADKFVAFGEHNNMHIIGHCLVWHSQTPNWIFVDKEGNDVSRKVLIQRMKEHIYAVVGRYKGRVHGWDVVNEAVADGGGLRESKWLKIIGEDYIELAFKFAHEADPKAELYYNDYNLYRPGKREEVCKLIKNLKDKGSKIDAVGMQAHYLLGVNVNQVENSITAFSGLGVKVMLTELDISVLPYPSKKVTADISAKHAYNERLNPFPNQLTEKVQEQLAEKYASIFKILLKYDEAISRVTFWGVNDGGSWKNNFPVKGRTDYPLLFDRDNNPKPAFYSVSNLKTN